MPENVRTTLRDVPLIQLGVYQCRFPVSEDPSVPGGYRFCAGPTSPDRVYCDHHHSIVTAVDPRRARLRDAVATWWTFIRCHSSPDRVMQLQMHLSERRAEEQEAF